MWAVPPERIEAFGTFVAGYRNVSHCYQRPTYEDWPYSVFSMIHAPRVDGVEEVAEAIAAETGVTERRVPSAQRTALVPRPPGVSLSLVEGAPAAGRWTRP